MINVMRLRYLVISLENMMTHQKTDLTISFPDLLQSDFGGSLGGAYKYLSVNYFLQPILIVMKGLCSHRFIFSLHFQLPV